MQIPESQRARIMAWLESPKFRPMSKSELARAFDVHPNERAALRATLDTMVREGLLELRKGTRYGPAGGKADIARGVFETSSRGRNTVRLLSGGKAVPPGPDGLRRLIVPDGASGVALHGDVVEIRLKRRILERPPRSGRPSTPRWSANDAEAPIWEARVLSVLEEGRRATTGIFRRQGNFQIVEIDDRKFPEILKVGEIAANPPPKDGDLVHVRILFWDNPARPPVARVEKVLGRPDAPGNAILALIHRLNLPQAFPDAVLRESDSLPDASTEADLVGREDWRDTLVVTIDPFDARDFDDAIHVHRSDTGWALAVHIADVAHYIKPGSALDAEARERGNSVYLVDRVLPMLPEKLSNGLCSLVPDQDRLSRLVWMEFDLEGKLRKTRFASAVIRSARRFTYEEVSAILNAPEADAANEPTSLMLHEAWRLASLLRRRRFKAGSLDLDFPEVKVVLDSAGCPIELRKIMHDSSHQLIEECMLMANEAVAKTIREAGLPCIYRIHEDPDENKLWEFRELARLHGFSAADLSSRSALQALLRKIRGTPEEHTLKLGLLKSLKRARYAADPRGHYGLAKDNYLHFTSPIRRYADLVAHRVLGQWHGHKPKLPCPVSSPQQMDEIANHISQTERIAAEAETESRRIKEYEYFERQLDLLNRPVFQAVVTEAKRIGLFIELIDTQIRGLVPVRGFPSGDWWFEGEAMRWRQARSKQEWRAGSKLSVRIDRVDRENQFLDFTVV